MPAVRQLQSALWTGCRSYQTRPIVSLFDHRLAGHRRSLSAPKFTRSVRGSAGGSKGTPIAGATNKSKASSTVNAKLPPCPQCSSVGSVKLVPVLNDDPAQYVHCTKCGTLSAVELVDEDVYTHVNHGDLNAQVEKERQEQMKTLPVPKQIDTYLSSFVIGQSRATRLLSVSVYNHFKRITNCPRPVAQGKAQQQQQQLTKEALRDLQDMGKSGLLPPFSGLTPTGEFPSSTLPPKIKPTMTGENLGTILMRSSKGGEIQQQTQTPKRKTTADILSQFDKAAEPVRIDKSNIIMIGPTGCGKTHLAKTVAQLLDVPFTICDCTSLTAAGYVGEDVDTIIERLLVNANNDVERAQGGIVFLDEVDKICASTASDSINGGDRKDVGGVAVQQALLRMVEGCVVDVGANRKSRDPPVAVDTSNVLFITSGAFTGLTKHIKQRRVNKTIGFNVASTSTDDDNEDGESSKHVSADDPFGLRLALSERTTVANERERIALENDENDRLLTDVQPRDMINYGLIPEFVGRFPVIVPFVNTTEEMLVQILVQPANSLLKQYQQQFKYDGIDLQFTPCALTAIARRALKARTGARSLRVVIEDVLTDAMYECPGTDVEIVIVDEDVVNGKKPYTTIKRAQSTETKDDLNSTPTTTQHEAWKEEKQSTILL